MGRSKARQLELDQAQAKREVAFHFENMVWKHYAAEDMTNEGGFERLETSWDSVMNYPYKTKAEFRHYPTPASFDEMTVTHIHGYLEALGKAR
jgi:hypothetical protein